MRTYVGTVDPTTGQHTVVITDQVEPPEVAKIGDFLHELAEVSTLRHLGRPHPEPERRARALERKHDLLDRIRAADLTPVARPLDHRALHSPDGFAWGYAGSGPADLAYAILQRELVEEVPAEVYLQFRDQVVAHLPADGFRLPATEVWDWVRTNRALVDEKVFGVEPDQPVLSVVDPEAARTAETTTTTEDPTELTGPTASELVLACESAWDDIRTRHPELPEVVIVLGSGVERGRLVKLGHWWGGRWIADGQVRGEVLLAGEALHLEPKQVFEVLLHEAAHGINAARGVKDTSRGGRYHNEKFAATARDVGLHVTAMPPYGLARTELTAETEASYEAAIKGIGDAMRIARQLDGIRGIGAEQGGDAGAGPTGGAEAERSRNAPVASCGCGRKMRMHASVFAQGPVVCGLCETEFTTGAEVRQEVEPGAEPSTVDTSFGVRRQEALAAERDQQFLEMLEVQWSLVATAIDDPTVGVDGTVGPLRARLDRIEAAIAALGGQQPGGFKLRSGQTVEPSDGRVHDWYSHYGTATEVPMVAADPVELDELQRRARALLRRDGVLRGPDLDLGPLDVAVGDRVIMHDHELSDSPPPGTMGSVVAVDSKRGTCTVEFATWGALEVGSDSTEAAVLSHDYATLDEGAALDPTLALQAERERAMAMELEP